MGRNQKGLVCAPRARREGQQGGQRELLQEAEYVFPYHYIDLLHRFRHGDMIGKSYHQIVKALIGPLHGQWVLDACCGDGRFCYELQEENVRLVGVDHSERAIRFARAFCPNVAFVVSDVATFEGCRSYDVIVLMEALEHLRTQRIGSVLANLARCLEEDGRLVVTVPSRRAPLTKKHYQHFTPDTLRQVLSPYFEVESLYGHLRDGMAYKVFRTLSRAGAVLDPIDARLGVFRLYFYLLQWLLSKIELCAAEDGLRLIALCSKAVTVSPLTAGERVADKKGVGDRRGKRGAAE